MINDEANTCYYLGVRNLSELNSLGLLMGKKEATVCNDNSFENALGGALNYQTIKTHPDRISKLMPYINKYNLEGLEFLVGPKEWIKFERNNKTIALNVLSIQHNTKKKKGLHTDQNITVAISKQFC